MLAVLNQDPWTVLLREAIVGDALAGAGGSLAVCRLMEAYESAPPEGPNSQAGNKWSHDDRWLRCTEPILPATTVRHRWNGLDFLSMVALMRLHGLLPDPVASGR